ncbi:hypothetical protein HZS92_00674 [Xanthomonas citri pv. citri]|nr:hypothetical protein HZS91_00716 [Xanthomonas citri pv. citri]QYF38644.1 hypothetical protein HZS92_00674 [Xanthomonas citri pv. citri]QYF43417.1 hypothetical protein HZS93_00674 [Xanthomonas citri]
MYVEVSAERPVAHRDKACALSGLVAWARRATRHRRATGRFPEGWPSTAPRAARLALAPAKPAPRSARSAPLAANASRLNVHNTL